MLFAGLSKTNKSATSLLFSSDLLSPSVLSGHNRSPNTCFSRGTTRLMSWTDEERYSFPLQFLVVSLSSYLSYPLLSFLGLEAYCLIKIIRHTGSFNFHRGTCAPSSCSLNSLSFLLQRTQSFVKLLPL